MHVVYQHGVTMFHVIDYDCMFAHATIMIRPAGSPTVTLLRLLPGSYEYDQICSTFQITYM